MFEFINYSADRLQILLLVMLRTAGMFIVAPIFSYPAIPAQTKIGIILLLAILLTAVLPVPDVAPAATLWDLVGLVLKELLVGVLIGTMFAIVFWATQTAGAIVGYQLGLAIANVFDPITSNQTPIIGQFWLLVTMLIFIAIDGHHMLLAAIVDSYAVIPAGQVFANGAVGELMIKYTAYVFIIALKLAAPVMVTVFLVDVVLGIVAKTMPTMNVFFVGFPLKVAVGLAVLSISMPVLSYMLRKMTVFLDGELRVVMAAMGRA